MCGLVVCLCVTDVKKNIEEADKMLRELCTVGSAGCQNRPFFRRRPISDEGNRATAPCPPLDNIPLPHDLRRLYETGKDNEYYLGERVTFFAPSYVKFLFRTADGTTVGVAVERGSPATLWSYDPTNDAMISQNRTCSFEEFVEEHL